jgi:hypothetical protein
MVIDLYNGIAEPNDNIMKIPFSLNMLALAKGTFQKCVGLKNLFN